MFCPILGTGRLSCGRPSCARSRQEKQYTTLYIYIYIYRDLSEIPIKIHRGRGQNFPMFISWRYLVELGPGQLGLRFLTILSSRYLFMPFVQNRQFWLALTRTNWVLPQDYGQKDPCNFNTEMFVSKVRNPCPTLAQLLASRILCALWVGGKQQKAARARFCTQSCSTLGQFLTNSPSHGKLQGSSLQ